MKLIAWWSIRNGGSWWLAEKGFEEEASPLGGLSHDATHVQVLATIRDCFAIEPEDEIVIEEDMFNG